MTSRNIKLNYVLVGDELGQLKLVQLNQNYDDSLKFFPLEEEDIDQRHDRDPADNDSPTSLSKNSTRPWSTLDPRRRPSHDSSPLSTPSSELSSNCPSSLQAETTNSRTGYRIVRILDECLQREPAISRSITNIRPIEGCQELNIDSTDKPNNLFVIANKVGQLFVCDTDTIRFRLKECFTQELMNSWAQKAHPSDNLGLGQLIETELETLEYESKETNPMISPIYYNMNSRVPVMGAQPINQTNLLVLYRNGNIQHVNINQDVLQSTLKIKRKAIKMLGLGYNSDARAVHWRIDGATGLCYFETDNSSSHMDEDDPLTEIVLSSPTHKLTKEMRSKSKRNLAYGEPPSIQSHKFNAKERLVPTQVINMITSRPGNFKPNSRMCKWTSITSLNLIYRKLALYDLVGSDHFGDCNNFSESYSMNTYKLNGDRLAVGGYNYAARVYDVQSQKPIYNILTGPKGNPLRCSNKGESAMVADLDWLGGNKTTYSQPHMLATCSGSDSLVFVYDLRSSKPIYDIDLTYETENKWQSYDNHHKGAIFTNLCASGAPHSTAVPSQQIVLGTTNGQLHLVDLRFLARSQRHLGRMSGFSGGAIKELRFVSESSEISKVISCSNDRFMRIHRIQTAYTSFLSQRLAAKIFLSTKPTCIQPVCDELGPEYYSSNLSQRHKSVSHLSTYSSGSWSLF